MNTDCNDYKLEVICWEMSGKYSSENLPLLYILRYGIMNIPITG